MFCFYLVAFLGVFHVNALAGDEEYIFNTRQSHNTNINDADYWDNDDFVPYKNERHDSFDWRILKEVLLKDSNNAILSPFSVKLLLALLVEAAGAGTETKKELDSILPNLQPPVPVRELYKRILSSLKEESVHYDLNVGTKIFADLYVDPRQRFASIIKTYFDTDIDILDFRNADQATYIMNNWCSNITAGHIQNLVSPDDVHNSVMVMLNAIYFDGLWKRPFLLNNTIELPFFVTPSENVRATFMTQTDNFYYFESSKLNAKLIRLPYKGKKFAMTILLPNAKGGLEELIREIEGDSLKRLQWLMDEKQVKVTIPKFKFDYTSHLKDVLKSLGIKEIFAPSASLPGLARGSGLNKQLQVSNIIQKAGLIVHEKGSTAYAATEVSLVNKFGGNTVDEFNANRPFLFLIEDESTGTILFAGKVTNPSV